MLRGTDSTKHNKRPPAPPYKSAWMRSLQQLVFACSRAISFGPADHHGYTATGLSGGHDGRKTPVLGISFHSFGFDTHHLDPLPRVMGRCWGAHFIIGGFDTQHPDPLLQAMGSTP